MMGFDIDNCISQYMVFSKINPISVISDDEENFKKIRNKNVRLLLLKDFEQIQNIKIAFCISSNPKFLYEASLRPNIEFIYDVSSETCYKNRYKLSDIFKKKFASSIFPKLCCHTIIDRNNFIGINKVATFIIVNFNTSELVNCLIQSIYKNIKSLNYNIVVFDNSDVSKFRINKEISKLGLDIKIYDNTKEQLIKFVPLVEKYVVNKEIGKGNNYGSFKHIVTIDYMLTKIPEVKDNVILCDSDILIYKDIDFIDETKISVGSIIPIADSRNERIAPFLQYINKKMIKEKRIRYFDRKTAYGCTKNNPYTDTGYSILKKIVDNNLSFSNIDIFKYCVHLGSASFNDKENKRKNAFINGCKKFFDNSILFFISVDRNYEKFIFPYIYFARKFNPFSKFEIVVDDVDEKLSEMSEKAKNFSKIIDCEILIRKPKIKNIDAHKIRFLEEPEIKCEYTYCGDVDLLILENVVPFHVSQMKNYGTIFDNVIRYNNETHLSGLHFVKTKEYYEKTRNHRRIEIKGSDEFNLFQICQRSGLKFKPKTINLTDFKINRPEHGFHISQNRKPFKFYSTDSIDLNIDDLVVLNSVLKEKEYKTISKKFFDREFVEVLSLAIEYVKMVKFKDFDIEIMEFPKTEKKYVIYTCQTGNYDYIPEQMVYDTKMFDYFYFTDNPEIIVCKPWKVVDINRFEKMFPEQIINNDVKKARFIKTHPHLFFKNYERSIWIDANMSFKINPINLIKMIDDKCVFTSVKHPHRNCIYQEAMAVLQLKKDNKQTVDSEIECIRHNMFPNNYGMIESGLMIRNHNDHRCISLMKQWWTMIENYSRRDQLSFNYVCWKNGFNYNAIDIKIVNEMIDKKKHIK